MKFALSRVAYLVPVAFIVTLATFSLMSLLPGDPALAIGGDMADDEEIAEIRADLGLDKPVAIRYIDWLGRAFTGDLGRSYITEEPVWDALLERLPVTIELMLLSELIGLLLAIPTGLYCALHANSRADRLLLSGSFVVLALPAFIIALLLILTVAVPVPWIPAIGFTPIDEGLLDNLASLLLPSLALGIASWPGLSRIIRSDVMTTLQQDYILLAKAKGLTTRQIMFRHAFRPSTLTLVAFLGLSVANRMDGVVILEMIFALPGVGRLLLDGIYARDYVLVQGVVLFIAMTYLLINLAVDLLLAVVDPRIRQR